MVDLTQYVESSPTPHRSVEEMGLLIRENRAGMKKGIYSVCSANPLVLEAAFAQAREDESPLLIEATCNQVNQEGGYTGLTPAEFRDYVHCIAKRMQFSTEKLILGGDHLGPNPWRLQSAAKAMEKACAMVSAYVRAGFSKIHLDASMPCGEDPRTLAKEEIAQRAARLCEEAELATLDSFCKPVYIIGTEVPTPGGSQDESEIEITSTASLRETLDLHYQAFSRRDLLSVWDRIIGVVVQPGVEFSSLSIVDYAPEKASDLTESIAQYKNIVFEAHSTDYQTAASLQQLVGDHFGILKVGPELTFVMREAIFGLDRIEEEWIADGLRSNIRTVIERVMVEHPENWSAYYHGTESQLRIARSYSFSDRVRYYWPNTEVSRSLDRLIQNLQEDPPPLPLVAQYLPHQAEAIRAGAIENNPHSIIRHRIQETLSRYSRACRLITREKAYPSS